MVNKMYYNKEHTIQITKMAGITNGAKEKKKSELFKKTYESNQE